MPRTVLECPEHARFDGVIGRRRRWGPNVTPGHKATICLDSDFDAGDGKKTSPAAYTLAGVAARPGGTAASASSWCAARSTSPSPPRRSVRKPCQRAPCSSSLFEKMLSRAGSFAAPRSTHFWRTAERSLARRARPRVIRSMRPRRISRCTRRLSSTIFLSESCPLRLH